MSSALGIEIHALIFAARDHLGRSIDIENPREESNAAANLSPEGAQN